MKCHEMPSVGMVDAVAGLVHRGAVGQVAHIIHKQGTGQGGTSVGRLWWKKRQKTGIPTEKQTSVGCLFPQNDDKVYIYIYFLKLVPPVSKRVIYCS